MTVSSGAYSFLDVQASIDGPGGKLDIGSGGLSDEGIRIAMESDKDTLTMGANGDGMHSLRASTASRITISLLKTATVNAQLNEMYRYQASSSAFWGRNVLTITNPTSGDRIVASGGAFVRQADLGYASEGGLNVWTFTFVATDEILGDNYINAGV